MTTEQAIWHPNWYEMDQSIAVGQFDEFDFFVNPPTTIENDGLPVFYNDDWHERCRHLYDRQKKRILSIWHPVLGQIQSIDTKGLDYTFTMVNGQVLKVEAEESPGLVYSHPEPICDWRIYVQMESA